MINSIIQYSLDPVHSPTNPVSFNMFKKKRKSEILHNGKVM